MDISIQEIYWYIRSLYLYSIYSFAPSPEYPACLDKSLIIEAAQYLQLACPYITLSSTQIESAGLCDLDYLEYDLY